jgi:hypothetical protein
MPDAAKVTIRRNGRKTSLNRSTRLNESDKKNWLAIKDAPGPLKEEEPPNPRAVFDNLLATA